MASALLGGLKYPKFVAASGLLHCVGAVLYQVGYADTTLDVKMARYKKGGMLRHIGALGALAACASFIIDLMKK
jgi:hypothetical protein